NNQMSNFAQPVSMPCTQEQYEQHLRQPILELGYEENNINSFDSWPYLVTNLFGRNNHVSNQNRSHVLTNNRHFIPTFNPQLFIAIAAMRTGEEIHEGEYIFCESW